MEPQAGGQPEKKRSIIGRIIFAWVGLILVGTLAQSEGGVIVLFVTALITGGVLAVKSVQAKNQKAADEAMRRMHTEREERELHEQMQRMAAVDKAEADSSKTNQSKQELIMRLGNIDQYILVLSTEKGDSQRTVALQAAHSEMTTIAAKLASGQICPRAIDDPSVRQHAMETAKDLLRNGQSAERLLRDLGRVFRLSNS